MRNYMDIVAEHAVARVGDWQYDPSLIGALSKFIYDQSWSKVGNFIITNVNYEVARHNNAPDYIVGQIQPVADQGKNGANAGKMEFGIVLHLRMSAVANLSFRDKGKVLGYSNLHKVNSIAVKQELRGLGIAKQLYVWLVGQKILILGDREQYFGARRLWATLSRMTDVVVDIIDYDAETVIARNVTLHQGQYDADFDKRVWSYGEDKQHIRLVLRNVL
jgi:hypothetical protein